MQAQRSSCALCSRARHGCGMRSWRDSRCRGRSSSAGAIQAQGVGKHDADFAAAAPVCTTKTSLSIRSEAHSTAQQYSDESCRHHLVRLQDNKTICPHETMTRIQWLRASYGQHKSVRTQDQDVCHLCSRLVPALCAGLESRLSVVAGAAAVGTALSRGCRRRSWPTGPAG